MFDIGFTELMVIGLVALIVIGPERLPRVARTAGHLLGRMQRYVSDVKADINREMELEELRKVRDSMQQAASEFESSVGSDLRKAEDDLSRSVAGLQGEVAAAGAGAGSSTEAAPEAEARQEGAQAPRNDAAGTEAGGVAPAAPSAPAAEPARGGERT